MYIDNLALCFSLIYPVFLSLTSYMIWQFSRTLPYIRLSYRSCECPNYSDINSMYGPDLLALYIMSSLIPCTVVFPASDYGAKSIIIICRWCPSYSLIISTLLSSLLSALSDAYQIFKVLLPLKCLYLSLSLSCCLPLAWICDRLWHSSMSFTKVQSYLTYWWNILRRCRKILLALIPPNLSSPFV